MLAGRSALAENKVDELSRALLQDSSYKVRLTAALALGKLNDKAAVGPLVKALGDENKMVRGMAAQALGNLGDPAARDPLSAQKGRETDSFVLGQIDKALGLLKPAHGATQARVFLTVGPFSGGAKSVSPEQAAVVRGVLEHQFDKLAGVAMALPAGLDERNFGKSGMVGFLVDGNITRLDETQTGGGLESHCDVKVMVAKWPSKSILLWTNAGADVQTGTRPQDRANARRDCLTAAAEQLGDELTKFLKSQGVP